MKDVQIRLFVLFNKLIYLIKIINWSGINILIIYKSCFKFKNDNNFFLIENYR